MGRLDQLQRTWRLLSLLDSHPRGRSVGELSVALGVSVRTVYRDLAALQAAGFPFYCERTTREVSWRFVDGYRFSTHEPFSLEELCALELCRDFIGPLAGTWAGDAAGTALAKVARALSPEARTLLDDARGVLVSRIFGALGYSESAGTLRLLTDAILRRERLRMIYDSADGGATTMRRVEPYALFYQEGALYFAAQDERRRAVRTFAVHRVRQLEATKERFVRPAGFSLNTYLGGAFKVFRGDGDYAVQVRISPAATSLCEGRKWHPSQRERKQPNGGLELRFQLSALEEVCTWILGFRGEAEAVEPPALRRMVREASERTRAAHAEDGESVSVSGTKTAARSGTVRAARGKTSYRR